VQDFKHGLGRPNGIFNGNDEANLAEARSLLDKLKVPRGEIAKETVIQENLQTAQIGTDGTIKPDAPTKGRKLVDLARQVDGLPVFSSHFRLAMNQDRSIGYLELHWPEIQPETLREAHRLAFKVTNGWKPPEVAHAKVESVEAGIVHSPSVGYL